MIDVLRGAFSGPKNDLYGTACLAVHGDRFPELLLPAGFRAEDLNLKRFSGQIRPTKNECRPILTAASKELEQWFGKGNEVAATLYPGRWRGDGDVAVEPETESRREYGEKRADAEHDTKAFRHFR